MTNTELGERIVGLCRWVERLGEDVEALKGTVRALEARLEKVDHIQGAHEVQTKPRRGLK